MRPGAQNIWYQPLDGFPARQVTHFPDSDIFDFLWSKDGKQLAVTRGRTRTDAVRISNFSTMDGSSWLECVIASVLP
jgi:Tol biopolymer transport system component